MSFNFTIPRSTGQNFDISLDAGQILFILGANGTGKSSLMQKMNNAHSIKIHRISAHRQTWFSSGAITMSPHQKRETEGYIQNSDIQVTSRWKDDYSSQRASISISDLIDAENVRARSIANAVDANNLSLAQILSRKDAPIKVINEILRLSNLPLEISVKKNEEVFASKSGGVPYSIAELSDGERNALLIAADVLTVPSGTLLLIDEPERHLHRSIISPLLTLLFSKRPDCVFVISTHDVMLPLDNSNALSLLVRGCQYSGSQTISWDVDFVSPEIGIEDDLMKDILGARRKVIFIEGSEQSLDKPLYSIIFPDVSIIAKSSCRDVESAVSGIKGASSFHWLRAFGIIDNDRRMDTDVLQLKAKGIYALSVYAVESIYYHPEVQKKVAQRYAELTGEDFQLRFDGAKQAALTAVAPHIERLSQRAVEKTIRNKIEQLRPKQSDIASGASINVSIDVADIVNTEKTILQKALNDNDLETVISRYPIRETAALNEIVKNLGFQNKTQYENAVRKTLLNDLELLNFVKSLFGTLSSDLEIV